MEEGEEAEEEKEWEEGEDLNQNTISLRDGCITRLEQWSKINKHVNMGGRKFYEAPSLGKEIKERSEYREKGD